MVIGGTYTVGLVRARAHIDGCYASAIVSGETVRTAERLSPPLKWAGGKRWQLPYLSGVVAVACTPAFGGTVLWRPRHRPRPATRTRPSERRQSSPDELLRVDQDRPRGLDCDGERRKAVLPSPRSLQRVDSRRESPLERISRAVLLPEPDGVQTGCAGSTVGANSIRLSASTRGSRTPGHSHPIARRLPTGHS